jgi:regulator of RNase E activity RraA
MWVNSLRIVQKEFLMLEKYATADISDALTELGLFGQLTDILPVSGSFRICGPAYTVEYSLERSTHVPPKHHIDDAPKGSVIVIKAPKAPNAVWGGLASARCQNIGVLGVVVQGRVRDVSELSSMNFPVYSKGKSTMKSVGLNVSAVETSLVMNQDDWQVTVAPGDIIVADDDGVVSVPRDKVDLVASICARNAEIDAKCMHDVLSGSTLKDAIKTHRK